MPPPRKITVEYEGRTFDFQVHERDLVFGRAGKARYWWMDGRQLRKGAGGPNFRPCVDLWWHVVTQAGADREPENEMTLVLAECYPLINTAKTLQDIYVDAHLHASADREYSFEDENGVRQRRAERTYLLPEDEIVRLRQIADSRNSDLVRTELERLFLGELPPAEEMPALDEAAQAWIGNGIVALRREGREGLQGYTRTVDEWIRRFRKRGGVDRVRTFVNMFSYECKVAFYLCYANAWIGILESLRRSDDIDALSERFMRLWHNQNRIVDDDAEVHRDAFCGQILALHPLSAVVLTSPQHLAVLGQYLSLPDLEALIANGKNAETEEYWNLVSTVLVAAHEYDRSRQRWDELRDHPIKISSDLVEQQARDDATASVRLFFEEYVAVRGHFCPECSGPLTFLRYESAGTANPPMAIAHFVCTSCNREAVIEIGQEDSHC